MPDLTPGITHYVNKNGDTACGIEFTSEWDETDDAEVITANLISLVDCQNCLDNI